MTVVYIYIFIHSKINNYSWLSKNKEYKDINSVKYMNFKYQDNFKIINIILSQYSLV